MCIRARAGPRPRHVVARRIGLPSTGLLGACRMPSSGNTTASTVCRPATNRNAGNLTERSRSNLIAARAPRAARRDPAERIDTASGDSENRCRLMSECAEAVPESTGPTSRGSKSAISRIACSAERRRSAMSASRAGLPRTDAAARSSAASISVLRGRIEASVTPRRSAALRLANRKSSMPCSPMMRAASSATARRSISARGFGLCRLMPMR